MNFAFCYENVLPHRGGCETYIAGLTRRLVADGHQVYLYACDWDPRALPPSVSCQRVTIPRYPRFLRPWYFNAACQRALSGANHDLSVGFDRLPCVDVVYPQSGLYVANAAHNLLKHGHPLARLVFRWAKVLDPSHHSHLALERALYRKHRPGVIAISNMVRGHLQHYFGLPAEDIPVVHIAANPAVVAESDRPRRRLAFRAEWGLAADQTVGLFAGINYTLKGLVPLLHALRQIPRNDSFVLLIAGREGTQSFQQLARRLGVNSRVRFLGYRKDIHNCYFASDFLVHPTFYDPCSNVVLEALACGLPVITSRYNGASELMHPPAEGLVVDDPHDVDALARALIKMLNPGYRAACAQAARRAAERWTFEDHYQKLLGVFGSLVTRKQAA
jgi:UDP-glucose:(heptosyl)LPS alpha-1,3-glucosyltransferase